MGADRWADCPRCKHRAEAKHAAKVAELPSLYGKVPAEEYLAAVEQAEQPPNWKERTFREDYEIGITDQGGFKVNYSGHCTKCKLYHRFKHAESFYDVFGPNETVRTGKATLPRPLREGWQCPVCKAVMAPGYPTCVNCTGKS